MFYAFVVEVLLRLFRLTWRVEVLGQPSDAEGPHLYAHWHGDELLLVPVFAGRRYAVMSSRSRDGEWMARLLRRLGYEVVRGSSSRGGAGGLKGLLDAVRAKKRSACLAVDGPRGPVYQVKPGIVSLAQWSGLPIYPAGAYTRSRWAIPRAWNEGYFPKPFARSVIFFGEPIRVPSVLNENEKAAFQESLRESLKSARIAAQSNWERKRFSRLPVWQRNPTS